MSTPDTTPTNLPHIMLDIETLGTAPDAVILSIGLCAFGPICVIDDSVTEIRLDIGPQLANGRIVDSATLDWWREQPDALRQDTFSGRHQMIDAFDALRGAIEPYRTDSTPIWCKGASFDFPILTHAIRRCGLKALWSYRQENDARTLYRLTGIKPEHAEGMVAHRASDDAVAQAEAAIKALNALDAWGRF